jgi:iron transport multicopper oxidase
VIQTITAATALYSGIGSYPLEGGYIYFNPTGDYLYAYSFGYDSNGHPFFTLAGKSASKYAGESVPTITTLNGQKGTGIVSRPSSVILSLAAPIEFSSSSLRSGFPT